MKNLLGFLLVLASIYLLVHCATKFDARIPEHVRDITLEVDDKRLRAADDSPQDWLTHGRNYHETRFSPLDQISASNIDSLGLVWSIDLGTVRGIETTPIVVNGIMYITGPWSIVYAIDVRRGELIWTYDPEVPRAYGEKGCCGVVNRGVAVYRGLVFLGSFDGRLIAINAVNGEKVWEVLTVDQKKAYTITGAPRVVNGKVIIGNGGAEYGVRGYITAYDAMTGSQTWRFYTVPGNPKDGFESKAQEAAAQSWTGEWWKFGGGGTAWDAMAFDPELNLLYVGTGNGSPWNREIRSPGGGDNLYLSSILALDPDNGELKWHYQTTPGDSWDYTATQSIILADIDVRGELRKVLMQAPKNGFFYVIDRISGEFISAKPYVYTNWAKEIDYSTGRPVETAFSRYKGVNAVIAPAPIGAHNWHPMAYNDSTGLVYIPAQEGSNMFGQDTNWAFADDGRSWNTGTGHDPDSPERGDSLANQWSGKLIAWDPVKQKEIWSVQQKNFWNAGVLATEDLVFQGTGEGEFKAYDASTGALRWIFPLEIGIVAPPVTYMVDGVQYITLVAGWGGGMGVWTKYISQLNPGRVFTFALGGKMKPPTFQAKPPRAITRLASNATPEQIAKGAILFTRFCGRCHGDGAIPGLVYSSDETFGLFEQIVGKGIFIEKGMPDFGDRLSEQDIADVKHYVLDDARKMRGSR